MIVEETTKFKFRSCHETKNKKTNPTFILIHKLKSKDTTTKVMRYDNASENKSLEKIINGKDWQMAIQF